MRVLVTGGTGRLGRALVPALGPAIFTEVRGAIAPDVFDAVTRLGHLR